MADTLTTEQRKLNMSRIRGRNTKPEMLIRRGLHARGFRYRLHDNTLIGRPDLVLLKFRVVVFVHGCFWHGHDCPMFRLPATNAKFWSDKIQANRQRDAKACISLAQQGWRILTIWECALRGPGRLSVDAVLDTCSNFIVGGELSCNLESVKIHRPAKDDL